MRSRNTSLGAIIALAAASFGMASFVDEPVGLAVDRPESPKKKAHRHVGPSSSNPGTGGGASSAADRFARAVWDSQQFIKGLPQVEDSRQVRRAAARDALKPPRVMQTRGKKAKVQLCRLVGATNRPSKLTLRLTKADREFFGAAVGNHTVRTFA